jgi:ubiquinone/menaquinone biosynthesis C-methylase UbiE
MLDLIRKTLLKHQKSRWIKMSATWDEGSLGLTSVVEALVDKVNCNAESLIVDLGSGSGQLSIPLAKRSKTVYAVDISPPMLDQLVAKAKKEGVENIKPVAGSIEEVKFDKSSIDFVVTNYALHHLLDLDKQLIAKQIFEWLKPGGTLIIGDMMFGRGSDQRDREIIKGKLLALVKRGPGGWFRIIKNVFRYSLRFSERPVPIETWLNNLKNAGFENIDYQKIVAEAVIMTASKPKQ